jgi:sporulation protein YhbH
MWDTIFRPYSSSDAQHSDRSAGDRLRHREKVRQSIRENIADIIAEESIIGRNRDRIIKVPIRGIKEYRFIHGDNAGGVAQGGQGELEPGDVIEDGQDQGRKGEGKAGNQPGVDYYETDVTLEELINIMFEDLELPDLERKKLREMEAERQTRRKGYRTVGIRIRLDRRRTVKEKLRRRFAVHGSLGEGADKRFPFHENDLVYRHVTTDIKKESNAVVLCMMDTSGSMDTMKKYLARSFFFLLCQFVSTKYRNVEIVFIAHHTQATEVTEEEFFSKGESGGTLISSAYERALEVIAARYHPSLWNIYAFHCSDGDNFEADNDTALRRAQELCEACNLFGYGEIKPHGHYAYESSMMTFFRKLVASNFMTIRIERKEDVYPCFRTFLSKDRASAERLSA